MRGERTVGIIWLMLGVVVLILSLIADPIGIGGAPGFGYKQIVGVILGVIASVVGLFITIKSIGSEQK